MERRKVVAVEVDPVRQAHERAAHAFGAEPSAAGVSAEVRDDREAAFALRTSGSFDTCSGVAASIGHADIAERCFVFHLEPFS
jgi:hypothetical protein